MPNPDWIQRPLVVNGGGLAECVESRDAALIHGRQRAVVALAQHVLREVLYSDELVRFSAPG